MFGGDIHIHIYILAVLVCTLHYIRGAAVCAELEGFSALRSFHRIGCAAGSWRGGGGGSGAGWRVVGLVGGAEVFFVACVWVGSRVVMDPRSTGNRVRTQAVMQSHREAARHAGAKPGFFFLFSLSLG